MTKYLPINSTSVIAWMFLAMAVVSSGCGENGIKLMPVSGIVTLDGSPLAHANINFRDAEGTGRRGAAARTNKNGYYSLRYSELRDGIEPGKYKVSITMLSPELPAGLSGSKEKVPPQYNKDTTLVVEVAPSGTSESNFDLVTK